MNTITIQDNKVCAISLINDIGAIPLLRKFLSFKMLGVEYTQAFKMGWNGWTCLISKKNEFPSGLLTKVRKFLDDKSIQYEVIDKRKPLAAGIPLDILTNLKALNRMPRDYQLDIVNAVSNNDKGIVRATTGSGKSIAIAMCVSKFNVPTTIFVIGLSLLNQFHKMMETMFNEPIGYIGNSICDIHRLNVCSIWTAGKAVGVKDIIIDDETEKETFNLQNKFNILKMLKETKLCIFDECHSITTNTIKEIFKIIDPPKCYGFSATPYRDDGSDLLVNGYLGEQIVNITASELIAKKVLAQPIIKFVDVPLMKIASKNYNEVYTEYVVENAIRNHIVLNETKKLIEKKYKVLVLYKSIKHGKILAELFAKNGIRFELLSGRDDLEEREEVQCKFENGEIDVILGSVIFNIGIDLPIASGLVLAGGGKSSIACMQKIGRVVRAYPGKKFAAVVDFYDNVKYLKQHSLIRYKIYKSEPGFIILPNAKLV